MDNINKLYSVQFINPITGNHRVIGVFRDERIANEFAEDENKMLLNKMLTKNNGVSLPEGNYVVNVIYTDF